MINFFLIIRRFCQILTSYVLVIIINFVTHKNIQITNTYLHPQEKIVLKAIFSHISKEKNRKPYWWKDLKMNNHWVDQTRS
jgi:hypothetical protein